MLAGLLQYLMHWSDPVLQELVAERSTTRCTPPPSRETDHNSSVPCCDLLLKGIRAEN